MPVRRIEHVGLMVANLETSISFYEEVVGLQLMKRMSHPNPDLKLAFLGVEESKETILELIEGYNSSGRRKSTSHLL